MRTKKIIATSVLAVGLVFGMSACQDADTKRIGDIVREPAKQTQVDDQAKRGANWHQDPLKFDND